MKRRASGSRIGIIGGPMNLDEGYRWNVPVLIHSFEWPISGAANVPFVLQASTDLTTWKSLTTNSNDGSVFTFFQWFPTGQQRFTESCRIRASRPFGGKTTLALERQPFDSAL